MCVKPKPGEKVVAVRCQPKTHPCPTCGRRAHRKRRLARQHFSGFVCIDELHLGDYTLLLATDPIADRVIGHLLVRVNDSAHMRRFVRMLQYWGFEPKVVVTDGSNLYPAVLQEVWP